MKRFTPFLLLFLSLSLFAFTTIHAQTPLPIGTIQGELDETPYDEQFVTLRGIVTGVFARTTSSGNTNWTIFVQDSGDENPDTSDGMAVYVGRNAPAAGKGDEVTVTGEAIEFYGLTEIGSFNQTLTVNSTGNSLPAPTVLAVPGSSAARDVYFESLEGMRVSFGEQVGVVVDASACEFTLALNEAEIPVLNPTDTDCDDFPAMQPGEQVAGITGPLVFNFDEYKIVHQNPLSITRLTTSTARLVNFTPSSSVPPVANGESAIDTLKITEVYYITIGSDEDEEWIELSNIGDETLDISRFKIGDEETRGDSEGFFRFPEGSTIEPGRSILIAQNAAAFQLTWGFKPNYELTDSDREVPDLPVVEALGTGNLALNNQGDEVILLDTENAFVDGLSYGGSNAVFQPPIAPVGRGESVERRPADCDWDVSADFIPQRTPNPGILHFDGTCTPPETGDPDEVIAGELPPIGQLQGNGDVSPFVNEFVAFEGVVTAIHEDQNTSGVIFYSVFIQDLPGKEDGDPATSDAIAAFFGREKPDTQIGDHVVVTGQMIEYFGLSEIADDDIRLEVLSSNNPLPTPIEIDPPITDEAGLINYYESLEGMRVHLGFEPARVVGATFDGCGMAVVRQSSGLQRVYRRQISDSISQVIPVLYQTDVACPEFPNLKTGDEISGLYGVMTYNFEQYKLLVGDLSEVIIDEAPMPVLPTVPPLQPGQFSIISFNVENFFDGNDDTGLDAEPKLSPEEIEQKRNKIAVSISEVADCPTIVAIQEVENAALMDEIANALANFCPVDYAVEHLESADGRGIDVAWLVNTERVAVDSAELARTCTDLDTGIDDPDLICENGTDPLFSRPPFVLRVRIDGRPYTLINNHFKSKRGGEASTERRRIEQAFHVNDLVAIERGFDPAARVVVIGDLNDYENSRPLRTLEQGGLVNLLKQVPEPSRYTFVFSGVSQLIDGLLSTPEMAQELAYVTILHTNADFPDAMLADQSPERIAFKATDHDIPYAVFNLTASTNGEPADTEAPAVPTPTTAPDAPPVPQEEGVDSRLLIAGGVGLMLVAAGGGFVFGRKKSS